MNRIFWLDDEAQLTGLVAPKLEEHGYSVATCHQCRGAVEAARRQRPHIAILDVMLGDGGGYEVARGFRRDHALCPVPILYLSSVADDEEIAYAFKQGGDAYLAKPFEFRQLLAKLHVLRDLRGEIIARMPHSNLPGLAAMKRETDRRLLLGEAIALCCVQVVGLKRFRERKGAEEEASVLALTSRCLVKALKHVGNGYLSHMSNEYFLALVGSAHYRAFVNELITLFNTQARNLYSEVEWLREELLASGHADAPHDSIRVYLRVSIVNTADRTFRNATDMLNALADTHSVLNRSRGSAIFVDRKKDPHGALPYEEQRRD
ncbi:MAG: response regulator transcription factor [Candidatus Hydrogenedentota bacterium]